MPDNVIQTSFASGEWAPKLRGRVDVQKYRAGAALLRNFYVDYSAGGASTRPGTKFIAQVGANGARLIEFQASTTVSYVLEFGQNYIRFISNGAQVMSGGVPYQITSPYLASDLFPNQSTGNPGLKFVQDVTSLIICHPSYAPQILTIISPTNWTLTAITFGPTLTAPSPTASTNLGAGIWNYAYIVTAVDTNGQESPPSTPATLNNLQFLGSVSGTNTVTWTAIPSAVSYNVYKAQLVEGVAIASGAQFGFIGNVTGVSFQDSTPGYAPDFAQTPPIPQNPFLGASVLNLTITGNANYTSVPTVGIAAPPAGGLQATAYASLAVNAITSISHALGNADITLTVSPGPNPTGALIHYSNGVVLEITGATFVGGSSWEITSLSIINPGSITSGSTPSNPLDSAIATCNAADFSNFGSGFGPNVTWDIGSLNLVQGGFGYTSTPAVTISGAATATATIGLASGGNPGVPGFFQERLVLAGQKLNVQGYNMSQPGSFFNFNISNPVQDDDAISGNIISEELNDIRWLIPVPTGIIAGTGKGAWTINGGGGISTLNPITPANQTASPQAFNGANDLRPQKVNFDVIYGTNKGSYFRDLTYNIYANIFTGTDITTFSNHLFFNHYFLDIAWSEEPFKTMWVVRDDGIMLSLAFVKEQEMIGWAHHDTNGQFKSVCSVIETVGNGQVVDAVYVIVQRFINGAYVQYVERMVDRFFDYGVEDSWSVDCGLQTTPNTTGPINNSTVSFVGANTVGGSITLNFTGSLNFNPSNIGWTIRASGGVFLITATPSGVQVTCTVVRAATNFNAYSNLPYPDANWTLWQPVTTVSGLTQLAGQQVVGVADGVAIGPLTVSGGGAVTLPSAAGKVTLGLQFLPQLRTLGLDVGEPTVQGKRKKISKLILRVADTLGLQIGTTFSTLVSMKDFQLGAIPSTSTGPSIVTDLVNPSWAPDAPVIDGLQIPDALWQENGQVCIQQNLPYPATICGVIPEITIGDSK